MPAYHEMGTEPTPAGGKTEKKRFWNQYWKDKKKEGDNDREVKASINAPTTGVG